MSEKYPANYNHWNLAEKLTLNQCVYLTLGIEPGSPLTKKQQNQFNRMHKKARKAIANGELKTIKQGDDGE